MDDHLSPLGDHGRSATTMLGLRNMSRRSGNRMKFSLRTLLIAILCASIPLAYLSALLYRGRVQHRAVESIVAAGGQVHYRPPDTTWAKSLLRRLAGRDAVDKVNAIILTNGAATDDLMIQVSKIRDVRELVIQRSPVTDRGIAQIAKMETLEWLDATGTDLTDQCVPNILSLKNLISLSFGETLVTNEGVMALTRLSKIEGINLGGCKSISLDGIHQLERALPKTQVWHELNTSSRGQTQSDDKRLVRGRTNG